MTTVEESSPFSPTSLLDLLSNAIIFDGILPYLSLPSIFALSRTSKIFQHMILKYSNTFRYLDLSKCRGAYIPPTLTPIDSGGNTWRAERIDENLTEDEFYAGPLRGVMGRLTRMKVLHTVQVLVLDKLASVTHDLISDIVTSNAYNVRLLSIRGCINVNQSKLQQLLCYLCRPGRLEGTPRLQGLYFFTDPEAYRGPLSTQATTTLGGVTSSQGAQLGGITSANVASHFDGADPWYAPTGRMTKLGFSYRSSWEDTIQACQGIINFDIVLCTNMHADMASVLHEGSKDYLAVHDKPGIPTLATIALGPEGCVSCGRAPHGSPVWGESDYYEFPLLYPPPFSGKLLDAVTPPRRKSSPSSNRTNKQRLIVSCSWCLANRHCDSCHRWWCADCYNPKRSKQLRDLENLSLNTGLQFLPPPNGSSGDKIKVFNGLCVENCLVGEWMAGAGGDGMWG